MEMEVRNPWTVLSKELKYENPWMRVQENKVLNPAGKDGIYGVVHIKDYAVAILPLDENNNTWIVGQYRFPFDTFEWEIIEGGCPVGKSPLETARRELHEEAGLIAEHFHLILEMQLSNSKTDEVSYSYIAKGISFTDAEPEETEQLVIRKLPFEELFKMVMKGEIKDALSIATVLKAKTLMEQGKL